MGYQRSNINVNLKNHFNSKVYTSSSPVEGDVTIVTKRDVRFDSIQIILVGTTKTRLDGVNSPQEVTHTFLKLIMPIPESTYPVPRVLETGRTYTIPFNFVIPNQLTINACNHKMQSDQLVDHHVQLPPTMGGWERDDMAPQMAQVEYVIKARVFREDDLRTVTKKVRVMEATQAIRVLPASVEDPPLNVTEKDKLYRMTKSKWIRKNLLSNKIGRLTAEAVQPRPALIKPDGRSAAAPTMAQIKLKFEPTQAGISPPDISSLSGKITAYTYFSSGTISQFPNLGDWNQLFVAEKRGMFSTSAPLRNMAAPKTQPQWTERLVSTERRDSGYGSESTPMQSPQEKSNEKPKKKKSSFSSPSSPVYYETTLEIPFDLPLDKKTLIPTFHSCITSRVYSLHLSLGVSVNGSKSISSTVSLTAPIQMAVDIDEESADGARQRQLGLPSFESALEEAEADAHLVPRVLQAPPESSPSMSALGNRGSIMGPLGGLPGYTEIGVHG